MEDSLSPFLESLKKDKLTRLHWSDQNFGVSYLCLYLSFPMENKGCNPRNRQADNVVGTQVNKCTHSLPSNSSYDTCHTCGIQMHHDTNWSLNPSIRAGSNTNTQLLLTSNFDPPVKGCYCYLSTLMLCYSCPIPAQCKAMATSSYILHKVDVCYSDTFSLNPLFILGYEMHN